MDNSQSPYAQLLASSSLLKVITDHTLRYEFPHENTIPELSFFLLELHWYFPWCI